MNTLEDQLVASTGLDVREIAEMLAEVDALIAKILGTLETHINRLFQVELKHQQSNIVQYNTIQL